MTLQAGTLSPDERWLSYTLRKAGSSSAVFVQPFPATGAYHQVPKSSEAGHHCIWSQDGRILFYTPGPRPLLISGSVTTTSFAMGKSTVLRRGSR